MRRAKGWLLILLVLTLVFGVVTALVLIGGSRRPSSPEDEVRDLVTSQIDMWDRSDFDGLYQTLSPAVRKVCGYSSALTTATAARAYWGEITVEDLSVHVSGTTASVTGVLRIPGQPAHLISANDPVIYTRIGNSWYLDHVPSTGGPSSLCQGIYSESEGGPLAATWLRTAPLGTKQLVSSGFSLTLDAVSSQPRSATRVLNPEGTVPMHRRKRPLSLDSTS